MVASKHLVETNFTDFKIVLIQLVLGAANRHIQSQGIQGQVKQMGHYTGAKARINRRLGSMIFESAGAIRASERRSDPPGVRSKETQYKPSTYGEGLIEKQKIKYYYGFGEKQLTTFFCKSRKENWKYR